MVVEDAQRQVCSVLSGAVADTSAKNKKATKTKAQHPVTAAWTERSVRGQPRLAEDLPGHGRARLAQLAGVRESRAFWWKTQQFHLVTIQHKSVNKKENRGMKLEGLERIRL